MNTKDWLGRAVDSVQRWQDSYPAFEPHPSLQVSEERFAEVLGVFAERMAGNYPYFHPSYAGQMLKPPHPAAVAGYLAAMLVNPNNHALDGGLVTSELEKEAVASLAAMFGFGTHLGHLTSSGTIANLEALYVARELHPGARDRLQRRGALHPRADVRRCSASRARRVTADGAGRIDTGALDELLTGGQIGTVVATAGTTGLGAIDPVHEVLAVARRHGVRVHVDAAYGGFFTLLAEADGPGCASTALPWRAIADCDSVVVDPHKHGLQPYGCGAVLFGDPSVGRFYAHDSPYTYFTSQRAAPGRDQPRVLAGRGVGGRAVADARSCCRSTADGLGRGARRLPWRGARLGQADRLLRAAAPVPAARARHRELLPGDLAAELVRHRPGIGAGCWPTA